jgi:uroporphyrinogen-III decarboxylase
MDEFLVIAMTEKDLFHELLRRFATIQYPLVKIASEALPGRLWRIVGAEYASAPYLPPNLFREFVTEYDTPIVKEIQSNGGYARIHSHGRLAGILDHIVETGCDALDPVEPPPQGDVELLHVRERYGKQLVLFGNLEISDMETLPEALFREKVKRAIVEGTSGSGRGFVLMPSASPYGRKLSPLTMRNYEVMIQEIE